MKNRFETFQEYEERTWKKKEQPPVTPETKNLEPKSSVALGGKVVIVLHWNDGTYCWACHSKEVDELIFKLGPPDKIVVREHPEVDGLEYKQEKKDVSDSVSDDDKQCRTSYQNESCDLGWHKSRCIYGKSCLGDCLLQRQN